MTSFEIKTQRDILKAIEKVKDGGTPKDGRDLAYQIEMLFNLYTCLDEKKLAKLLEDEEKRLEINNRRLPTASWVW